MSAIARLYGLGTALPVHKVGQPAIQRFMTQLAQASLKDDSAKTVSFLNKLYASCGIAWRHSALSDYGKKNPDEFDFYPRNWALEPFPTTQRRMEIY